MAGATAFSQTTVFSGISQELAEFAADLPISRILLLAAMQIVFLSMPVIPRPEGRGCKGCPPKVDNGDLKYHLVLIPKYRKSLLLGSIEKHAKKLFYEIAEEQDFEILAVELMADHMHLFVSAARKWAPGKIVGVFKAITSKIIFEEFPQVKQKL